MEKQLWYYICTQRPACPGAIPRGVVHIEDMTRERAEEIGCDGYDIVGWIENEWLCSNPLTNCC